MSSAPPALVVGTAFGLGTHVPGLRTAGFEVVGLVGSDPERTSRRAEKAGIAHAFTDLDTAIQATGATLVSIATPPATHAELTLTAIARGCHVMCEKPFARDSAEAVSMLDAARKAGIVHRIGHEFRWEPTRATLARAVADGLVGKPGVVSMVHLMPLVANRDKRMPDWWFDTGAGGGWLGAHGSHLLDQIRFSFGEFASLSATLSTVSDREPGAEDSYLIHFTLRNGVQGVLQSSAGTWGPMVTLTRVSGTAGTVWIDAGQAHFACAEGARPLPTPADLAPPAPAAGMSEEQLAQRPDIVAFAHVFAGMRAEMDGQPAATQVPAPTFEDGVIGMQLLDAVRRSAVAGGSRIELG